MSNGREGWDVCLPVLFAATTQPKVLLIANKFPLPVCLSGWAGLSSSASLSRTETPWLGGLSVRN